MGDHDQLNKGTNHVAETKMAGSSPRTPRAAGMFERGMQRVGGVSVFLLSSLLSLSRELPYTVNTMYARF